MFIPCRRWMQGGGEIQATPMILTVNPDCGEC